MAKQVELDTYYLQFMEFLMMQKRAFVELGMQYGLTSMQAITLLLLDTPRPMHYITTTFNCDASNVTGIVDGLQHKGLAGRYESTSDRRIRMVELKPEGRKLRDTLLKKVATDSNPIFSKLNTEELKTFFDLIRKTVQE
jgi:DNA-binding MarR family transcriptional regulator